MKGGAEMEVCRFCGADIEKTSSTGVYYECGTYIDQNGFDEQTHVCVLGEAELLSCEVRKLRRKLNNVREWWATYICPETEAQRESAELKLDWELLGVLRPRRAYKPEHGV